MKRLAPAFVLLPLLLTGLLLAALTHTTPLTYRWLYADMLSALTLILLAAHGLVAWVNDEANLWPTVLTACLFSAAAVLGHVGLLTGLLLLGSSLLAFRTGTRLPLVAALSTGGGLISLVVASGEWLLDAPGAGAGLNSLSFVLLLAGTLTASAAHGAVRGHMPTGTPLVAVLCLTTLLRLFSLGPWNLGWLFAALVVGGATVLMAAWQAAAAPPEQVGAWLGLYLMGLAIAGAGLGSAAGVTLAGYALLTWPVVRLGLARPGGPAWTRWLFTGAVPLSAPFVAAWLAVAAAVAGDLSLVAVAFWGAALLVAVATRRLAGASAANLAPHGGQSTAAILSLVLGLGSPLVVLGLLEPLAAQLQGGLTPFGELALWPWAGLIALNAARQPVATLPSLALAALMVLLTAFAWVLLRLNRLRNTRNG